MIVYFVTFFFPYITIKSLIAYFHNFFGCYVHFSNISEIHMYNVCIAIVKSESVQHKKICPGPFCRVINRKFNSELFNNVINTEVFKL